MSVSYRFNFSPVPNDSRSVSDPLTTRPGQGSPQYPKPPMAGPVAAAQSESSKGLPRNSSLDSAISAMSSKSHPPNGASNGQPGAADIADLIKAAGSPEVVIQHLLKEKHSQSQQNGQLWRLVDKQRAMILGLNKDLERALKDKEKYRAKLKEVMANPAVSRAAAAQNAGEETDAPGIVIPRVDVNGTRERIVMAPDSPTLDSDSQKGSPLGMSMAPYPITPPADHPSGSPSVVAEMLNPVHSIPRPQEHAYDKYNHEAEEVAAEQARKQKADEQLREIPYNTSLPPSRSLPSQPPSMPPPKPPTTLLPTLTVVEATPRPDEGLSSFPAPPPRKPPPAPLQLKQQPRLEKNPVFDDYDSDSDYDNILEVDSHVDDKRGRRRTREEDDREREVLAFREAEVRSASKKSMSGSTGPPSHDIPPNPRTTAPPVQQEMETQSLAAVLNGDERTTTRTTTLMAPLMSPGLPASPRPINMKAPLNSPPLSPRTVVGSFPIAPLSPRPPRQPIPLPPNTALASPRGPHTGGGPASPKALNTSRELDMASQQESRSSPVERNKIYEGLVTEEYPDLLLSPNALPSIDVKVASSRMKPSRASLLSLTQLEEDPVFTLAILSRSNRGELWRVEKDSASLAKLDGRLKQCPAFTARTPDRSLFSGHAPAKIDARRVALEQYMEELLETPLDTMTAIELCRYLSTNTLPPNADEGGATGAVIPEGVVHKIGPDGRQHRSGYLTKKGKNFGGWKARFFVLDGPHLRYYEAPGGAHLGTIKLQNAQIGKQSHTSENHSPSRGANGEDLDNQYRHAFLVLEPKKKDSSSHVKHVLCAESDKERDFWVEALLQWIDYRDPEDEAAAPKGHAHDRHASGQVEQPSSAKPRKGSQAKPHHQPSDSDTLIGVRYDTTHAGDAPQSGPAVVRPKTSGGFPDQSSLHHIGADTMSSQLKTISGPKDPQPISDSAAWGNKAPLTVPTNDEKKARKRSFFGFGPKTRSGSDGQESSFGDSGTPPQNSYQGPVRQVFGAQLAEAVRYNPPTDANVPLPSVVYRCIQYLDHKNAVLEEGIFRLSGSNVVIKQLRERFNTEGDINLVTDEHYYDIHAVASLLKLYLRELPTTILTRDLHNEFMATTEMTDRDEKIAAYAELATRLPLANATLLKYLIAFLIKIINNSDINKMTVRNVGIVFSPTLNIPAPVFATFLQNYEPVFGIEPDEYELPSPVSESESHGRFDAPPRFDAPNRPLTSSGGASPHRQPRMESMRDFQRSTPTPPLININPARQSPTPSLSKSRQTYEPSYLAQQNGAPGSQSRPAYENAYGMSAGYDNHNSQSSGRAAPAYDRPLYQPSSEEQGGNLAAYDQQQFGTNNRRRESAVFNGGMMGLQHQGSKSRLREDARY